MVKVKICGLTNLEDALAAVEYGADMVGFIFAPSPRKVDVDTVKDIIEKLPSPVTKVGVFMNQRIDEVNDIIMVCGLDMAQLHGNESLEYCVNISSRVIKAFTPATLPDLDSLQDYKVEFIMLDKQKGADTPPEELWPIAKEMDIYGPVILAGSLTRSNVAEAIKVAQPYAVDVASGVEKEPGKKDHQKIKDFIRICKDSIF